MSFAIPKTPALQTCILLQVLTEKKIDTKQVQVLQASRRCMLERDISFRTIHLCIWNALLTKRELRSLVTGYWQVFSCVSSWSLKGQKRVRRIFSHLDRTRLFFKKNHFLLDKETAFQDSSCSQLGTGRYLLHLSLTARGSNM